MRAATTGRQNSPHHPGLTPETAAHRATARPAVHHLPERLLSTRSFIARPTDSGFEGLYCHYDGFPDHQLPLLLAAYNHRFAGDLDAMTRHLIDDVPVGWSTLGTDLLDGAPEQIRTALTLHGEYPSSGLDDLITLDGSPPERMTVTPETTEGLDWGYILRPEGIEVISLREYTRGPLVGWDTDPLSRISDAPARWVPGWPAPIAAPRPAPRLTTTAPAAADSGPQRAAARR
ncbi:hypothetical protein GCM10010232_50050 [Streptomyces amakusaensis]|uniref:SnoaL-like domain-containing protein n=1 Tax=Streptomyces amakusaensis TaxID=67271 RepID=A0ABW0AK07_9ACTN